MSIRSRAIKLDLDLLTGEYYDLEVAMHQAFEGSVDEGGNIRLASDVKLPAGRRAIVIVLDEIAAPILNETYLLSEAALAVDWNRPEEDAAWAYLQSEK
jgi:hypothetical protein